MKLQRHPANPILAPDPARPWESLVATNPGAWYDADTGEFLLLYRAAGAEPEHRVYLGLARSRDGVHFEREPEPVLSPSVDGFDAGCIEDPRIVKMGDWYYVTYACRAFPPGEYWKPAAERGYTRPECPPDFPWILRANATATGLALTRDFRTWIRAGRLTSPTVDDRDVILFPEKVGGRYAMLHRPMGWAGDGYPCAHPSMWIAYSEDLLNWTDSQLLATGGGTPWESGKIGGNTPPIRTSDGWLTLYHAVGPDRRYRLGALLLDLDNPSRVIGRSRDWLLEPTEPYEIEGFYPGVVFPCGKVVVGDTLYVYYGGADRFVGLATGSLAELLADLRESPPPAT